MTAITDEGWGILHDRTGTPLRAATAAEWKRSEERDVRGFYQVAGSPYGNPDYQNYVTGGPDGTVDADVIRALLTEAGQAGDTEQVRLCEVALGRAPGDSDRAWYACGQVVLDNRGELRALAFGRGLTGFAIACAIVRGWPVP